MWLENMTREDLHSVVDMFSFVLIPTTVEQTDGQGPARTHLTV